MYDELVAVLRRCGRLPCEGCPRKTCEGVLANMREAADAIEELSMKLLGDEAAIAGMKREIERMVRAGKPRWIPVTEGLPKMHDAGILKKLGINLRSDKCLIVISDGKDQIVDNDAELRDGKWYSDTLRWLSSGKKTFEVTHWMPLPAPPKEET